jgi:hypothetical protein
VLLTPVCFFDSFVLSDMSCNNVPSGTVVDSEIINIESYSQPATRNVPRDIFPGAAKDFMLFEVDDQGFDFLLVAQGGLKGACIE